MVYPMAMSGSIVDSRGNPFFGAGSPGTPDDVHKFQAKLANRMGKAYRKDDFKDEDAYNEMIVAKARMLKDLPFWGILALTVKLVEVDEIPTLATDGIHVYYNAEFVKKLTRGERVFAMAHEIYHCLYEHAGKNTRAMSYIGFNPSERDPAKVADIRDKLALWNYAADFIVNDGLVEARVGEFIKSIGILHDEKFRGWAVEEVYEHFQQNPNEVPKNAQTMDTHIEVEVVPDDEMGEGDGEQPQPGDGNGTMKVRIKQSDFEKMQKDWQDNMVSAAAAQREHEQRTRSAGCIPTGVQRLIDQLSKPKVDWKRALRRYVMAVTHHRYSFSRPNKSLFSNGWTLPGFRDRVHELDIVVMVDTSGSIGQEELTAFVSELQGIMNSWKRYKIHAWCFDGAVIEDSKVELVKGSHGAWDDVKKFAERIGGGGGTNFEVNWDYMKENRIKPRLALMLTDGMPFGSWGDVSYCPTMYMIIGNPRAEGPKGAITMHYEDA